MHDEIGMEILEERHDQLRRIDAVVQQRDQHYTRHQAGEHLVAEFRPHGKTFVMAADDFFVIVNETDGRKTPASRRERAECTRFSSPPRAAWEPQWQLR